MVIFIIIFGALFIILLCLYIKRLNIFIINYVYLVKFLLFNFVILVYYFLYLNIYSIFFIYKNYRFFSYYYLNKGAAFFYFSKKSIYFLFWRYLIIYLITTILFFFNFIINSFLYFTKNLFYINNVYIYIFIYIKIKYIKIAKSFLIYLYNYIVTIIYYFFYFINIDEMYLSLKIFKINIFNFLKYKIDPIGDRNGVLTWSSNVYNLYYKYININLFSINFLNFKNLYIFKKIIYFLITYFIWLLYLNFNCNKDFLLKNLLSNVYLSNRIIKKNIFIISLKIMFYIIHFIIINIIYFMCILLMYFIYSIFLFCNKFKYIFFYILLLFFCIKYYWIFYYFLLLLYNHYLLDLPLFEIKESTRFFNFEYIDLRNYFNLIFLHNTLIDLSIFNNVIYNDLLNNLNKTLSIYGFKINTHSQYDINLYSLLDVRNKDTRLLNDLLNVYNNRQSHSLLKWYTNFKKILNEKVSRNLFNYSKQTYTDYGFYKKAFERSVAVESLDNKEDSFLNFKGSYFFHLGHKENYIIWKCFNKGYFTKKVPKEVALKSVYFIKLNQIPLKYIHLYYKDKYTIFNNNVIPYLDVFHFALKKHVTYFIEWFKKWVKKEDYYFYFNHIYDFDNYKYNLKMKHKIPTLQWTSVRWRKKMADTTRFNPMTLSIGMEEQQAWNTFYEIPRKKLKKKRLYNIFYMDYGYPFSMLKKKHIFNVLNNNSNINLKIIKKYYFLKNAKIYSTKTYSKNLLYTNNLLLRLFFYRFNHWDNPFFKNYLNNKCKDKDKAKDFFNYNFWFFFDYLKTDKYYYSKYNKFYKNEESDINLYFLKRIRKDYIKLRNNLLRLYSLYFHYYTLEAPNYKHLLFNNSLPGYEKYERALWSYENFKISWLFKIYLTKERHNIDLFHNVSYLSQLFKSRFFAYFVYCDYTINSYNDLFYIKNKSYRLRVLNKVNNLKRFFYFQNKHVSGWSVLKYIRSFSLSYHIKHFLWHSPYSFLLFKDTFIIQKNNSIIFNFVNSYNIISPAQNSILINPLNYLMLFNLFLNIIEINNNWFYILNYNHINIKDDIELLNLYNKIFLKTYYNYYNNGFSVLMPFHFIDIYRFLMNFLFEYYNNFLYKLIRYRYVLDYKNYTFFKFIKRYFNNWVYQLYPRIRTQLYRYLAYSKMIKSFCVKRLGFKALNVYGFRAYRKNFLPFWFLYDYYIKLFVYFLLEKYYTKEFFILYWFTWFSNYLFYNYFLILFFLNFFNLKYFLCKNFNIISNINFLNIYNFFINTINKKNIYIWYMSIILKYDININIFYNLNYIKGYLIIKWFFLSINKTIFDINFNQFILIKIYIEKLLNYYFIVLFNIKNSLIYFKSNYYYYNKQRHSTHAHKIKTYNTVFKNTITYRNIYSFSHLTYNITLFKNIYLSNIYNYIYVMNMFNFNINNIFNTFFFIFKYNYMYIIILLYLLFYWFIILILYIYYKKFYNIFFFTYSINVDPQYNWEKLFNNNVIKMSNLYNKKKHKIYKIIWLNKINHNFYKFYLLNTFINKLSFSKLVLYKILFNNNKYNNLNNLNNNEILELQTDTNIQMWPVISFSNYFNFLSNFVIMPFKLKKENILYTFNFLNFFNNNLFNFCFFYWIILVPYFFFEYILMKYHLRGHVLIKHKLVVIVKILLDNFKLYVDCFKYIGEGMHAREKQKYPRSYYGYSVYKKKKRHYYFFKWDRYTLFHIKVSYLGNYYYWFFRINKIEYFLSFKNYFFNFSYNSIYFYYIYLYIFFLIIIMRKYRNKILLLNKAETANIKNK